MAVGNPKGTRDFNPTQLAKREYIQRCIESTYKKYGFLKIETPAFEHLDTLTGKYGNEGDKLLFKILNSGDFLSKVPPIDLIEKNSAQVIKQLSKKGLRYDLTVPFARFVVQHQNDIVFPFKRYQIQNVYRADRPQKGRYQEFLQCDADVIGTASLLPEIEFIKIYQSTFEALKLDDFQVFINHRKLLEAMALQVGLSENFTAFTVLLDKLDKVPLEKLQADFLKLGLKKQDISLIQSWMRPIPFNSEEIKKLNNTIHESNKLSEAIEELNFIASNVNSKNAHINLSLARGLDYYTGCIFEAKVPQSNIGSLSGGGRYDKLTDGFGLKNMSGAGISFGLDRIADVLEERNLWPKNLLETTQVLITQIDSSSLQDIFAIAAELRKKNIRTEVYPEAKKLKKQLEYANKQNIPFVITIGEEEKALGKFSLKDMTSGRQEILSFEALINQIQKSI